MFRFFQNDFQQFVKRQPYLAMLLHDIGKPSTLTVDEEGITHNHGHADAGEKMAAAILKRLKFDNDTIDKVRSQQFVKRQPYLPAWLHSDGD